MDFASRQKGIGGFVVYMLRLELEGVGTNEAY